MTCTRNAINIHPSYCAFPYQLAGIINIHLNSCVNNPGYVTCQYDGVNPGTKKCPHHNSFFYRTLLFLPLSTLRLLSRTKNPEEEPGKNWEPLS